MMAKKAERTDNIFKFHPTISAAHLLLACMSHVRSILKCFTTLSTLSGAHRRCNPCRTATLEMVIITVVSLRLNGYDYPFIYLFIYLFRHVIASQVNTADGQNIY